MTPLRTIKDSDGDRCIVAMDPMDPMDYDQWRSAGSGHLFIAGVTVIK